MTQIQTVTITLPVANQIEILVPPVAERCVLSVTCGWGAAVVEYTTNEQGTAGTWCAFPGAGTRRIALFPDNGLYARSSVAGVVISYDIGPPEG